MVDLATGSNSGWVCPNNRQLALRAKLQIGWSMKMQQLRQYGNKWKPLDENEQQIIASVVQRAEALDNVEQERIGKLVERLENMKRNTMGTGVNQCILCGDRFGLLGSASMICYDCQKAVCSKCGIESTNKKDSVWLCKICAETREIWKKSGAWFYKGLPKYVIPPKMVNDGKCGFKRKMVRLADSNMVEKNSWQKPSPPPSNFMKAMEERERDKEKSQERITPRAQDQGSSKSYEKSSSRPSERSSFKEPKTAELRSKFEDSLLLHTKSGTNGRTSPGIPLNEKFLTHADFPTVNLNHRHESDEDRQGAPWKTRFNRDCGTPSSTITPNLQARESNSRVFDYENCHFSPVVSNQGSQLHLQNIRDSKRSESDHVLPPGNTSSSQSKGFSSNKVDTKEVNSSQNNKRLSFFTNGALLSCIELTIMYESTANSLHISLHRAKGLKATDINGLADPFCKLSLLSVDGQSYRLRTKTVQKTRNPEFNEALTFYGVLETKLEKQTLGILVLDDDKYGHDILGEASFPLNKLRPHVPQDLCLPLDKHDSLEGDEVIWGENRWSHGRIHVTLCYSTRKHALIVGIIQCSDLLPMDNNGFSDPFIKLFLKPDQHRRKFKTSVKWKNLNPVFNEEFSFETKMTDLSKQTLCLTVWDKDYGKRNDYLGCLELGCKSKGRRLKQWVDMMTVPDHKHEGWHNLCDHMISEQ